ncbi:alpha/beta hydrolase [Limosilactobacillus sp.]|jgi:uncharacterized alpha/beta hydrolase family protein|uniref:alpha/beta hydrolase n=1 Tax=Limosilactobacillus sp. TaxID=2773925 RepID=UPI0025BD3760|nr:alpha/beta hydrolase [Limosilactobacillus sp.]MCH3921620.1 alpha/beta hydrolase [Limosilactobacillus sp.]MCH3928391.1 alpha/beta hydrolase [Limosilactobacillus sp.]
MTKGGKRALIVVMAAVVLALTYLSGFFGIGTPALSGSRPGQSHGRPVPTLFIHGFGGNARSSNMLIRRIAADGYGQRSIRATVSPNGKVKYTGRWHQGDGQPLVQVIFANNHEGDYHVAAGWIGTIVNHLHQKYGVERFNAVAHSYGNNAIVYYLATHRDGPARVNKLVDIASCVNTDRAQDREFREHQTGGFATYVKEMRADQQWYEGRHSPFNGAHFSDLNIYGTYQGKPSDGAVSHESAQGLRQDFAGITGTYQEREFRGPLAQHSALTRYNPAVAQAIAQFLKN